MDAASGTASTSTPVTVNVGAVLTIPHQNEAVGSTFTIPINIASANPANSGGLTQAIIAINYDPTKLKVTNVAEGSLIPADWIDFSNDTSKPGQIVVSESNITPSGNLEPITSTAPGSLAVLTFQVLAGRPVVPVLSTLPVRSRQPRRSWWPVR